MPIDLKNTAKKISGTLAKFFKKEMEMENKNNSMILTAVKKSDNKKIQELKNKISKL